LSVLLPYLQSARRRMRVRQQILVAEDLKLKLSSVANSLRKRLLVADKVDTCESALCRRAAQKHEVTSCRAVCDGYQLLAVGHGHCIRRNRDTSALPPFQPIKTIPCSTSESERGSSVVNLIMTFALNTDN